MSVRKKRLYLLLAALFTILSTSFAQSSLTGRVVDSLGSGIEGATVQLLVSGESGTTDANGGWQIGITRTIDPAVSFSIPDGASFKDGKLSFQVDGASRRVRIGLYRLNGQKALSVIDSRLEPGRYSLSPLSGPITPEHYLIRLRIGDWEKSFKAPPSLGGGSGFSKTGVTVEGAAGRGLAKVSAVIDTLRVSKSGYFSADLPIESYTGDHVITLFRQQHRLLRLDEYTSKMRAGWLGQAVGVDWGAPTEFAYYWDINTEVPAWDGTMVGVLGQDDLFVELTSVRTLDLFGIEVTQRRAAMEFAKMHLGCCMANGTAGILMDRDGVAPPDLSNPLYPGQNESRAIDYQIESDFSGLIAPGMANVTIELAEKFGRITNYGDGVYGGQFVGAMYTEAFFETDMKKVVEFGLRSIPAGSQYAQAIQDVLTWYEEDPTDWTTNFIKVRDKYAAGNNPATALGNGVIIAISLLYGGGDIEETIRIGIGGGNDSDCNPSNAAGILFTALGWENIPDIYTSQYPCTVTPFNCGAPYTYDWGNLETAVSTLRRLSMEYVVREGGQILVAGSDTTMQIPIKDPVPGELKQHSNPEPLINSFFTQEERDEIARERLN